MFRSQQNIFEDLVAKATDENLTSENWEYIMDVCDKVQSEENGGKDAVSCMVKRLSHRNANVQLYTLELANALSQNCGSKIYKELASRAFTDALMRLATERGTHTQVKAKMLERMAEWVQMFSKDPDLGIMSDQYYKIKSQNPNLHPPSAPSKSHLTDMDRQKEEDELQMALKLSIQDKATQAQTKTQKASSDAAGPSELPATAVSLPSGTTPATVSRVRALYDFVPSETGELEFKKGDIIAVLESVFKDWWKGSLRGQTGIFPLNYVEKLTDPTSEELEREARIEAEVFAEIKNVEKLLTLLSTSSGELRREDNEEITKLYQNTVAIRPKLIELIGKYSQKKDDFTQLNEKFIKARRDYQAMIESSLDSSRTYQYGRPNAPQQGYGGGGGYQNAPPQQDPARYYTPGPQDPQQYPETPSNQTNYPPRNSPAPFYIVANQGQQASQAPHPQALHPPHPPQASQAPPPQAQQPPFQRDPTPRIPSGSQPAPLRTNNSPPAAQYAPMQAQTGHRPQSTYHNPQELAITSYDPPGGGQVPYSASVYSSDEPYPPESQGNQPPTSQPPQQYKASSQHQEPPYPNYAPPQQPSQPTYDPPAPPKASAPAAPNPIPMAGGGSRYPIFGGRGAPQAAPQAAPYESGQTLPTQGPQGAYVAYSRPDASPGASAADFYRQPAN